MRISIKNISHTRRVFRKLCDIRKKFEVGRLAETRYRWAMSM